MEKLDLERKQEQQKQAFQRTVWLQIYLPMLAGVLLLGGLVAWIWIAGAGSASVWADSAFALLSIPALIFGLLVLGIVGGLVYVVFLVIEKLPAPAAQLQEIFAQIAETARQVLDGVAKPMLAPKAAWASLLRAWKILGSIFAKESRME